MSPGIELIHQNDAQRAEVTSIFNAAIAAPAIGAAWEVGLLDAVRTQSEVDVVKFARRNDLDLASLDGMVSALVVVNVVEREGRKIVAGRLLDEAHRNRSLFHWLTLGSGGLFSRMQYALRNESRVGTYYQRDPAAIAFACQEINREFFDPTFWTAMRDLDYNFHSVVDLGCGAGERLMQLMERYSGTTGIGVDIAQPSLNVAVRNAADRGHGERLTFYQDDVCQVESHNGFGEADLLTCFMMGHDFWPRKNCIETLRRLRQTFPNVRRFLLGDTTRILLGAENSRYAVTEAEVPMFTLGFEVGHALMGAYIPTLEEWESVFAESGWHCNQRYLIKTQSLSVIFALEIR